MLPGGMSAPRSGHFGKCDVFTIVNVEGGAVKSAELLKNIDHAEGGCMAAVNLVASQGIDALIVGGIGPRPLSGFAAAGIKVFRGAGATVGECVDAFLKGKAPLMTEEHTCRGH